MPALVNIRFGEVGMTDEDGTMVCSFSSKKSRKDCRISLEVRTLIFKKKLRRKIREAGAVARGFGRRMNRG